MVNTNEIMKGNILYCYETGENEIVVGFDSEYIYIDAITFDYLTPEDFEPVPLTGEILINTLGFENKVSGFFSTYGMLIIKRGIKGSVKFFYETNNTMINYVHELQNLYYAINKKHLTVNESKQNLI